MRMHRNLHRWIALGLVLAAASSCSESKIDSQNPEEIYKEAATDLENDRHESALEKFKVVKNKFPYSSYAKLAQLRIGDVYFAQDNFTEAAAAFATFQDLYPKHEKLPYAMFMIGESHFKDIPGTIARDLSGAQKALDAFKSFTDKFPNDPQSKTARERVAEVRATLAEKELYIGNFYYRRGEYETALSRYEKVASQFGDTPAAADAKERIDRVKTYLADGMGLIELPDTALPGTPRKAPEHAEKTESKTEPKTEKEEPKHAPN